MKYGRDVLMIPTDSLRISFFKKFNCSTHIDTYGYYGLLYFDLKDQEEEVEEDENGQEIYKEKDLIAYDLSFISEDEYFRLIEKSLETGKNLLFEACKDKKVIITVEMQNKAIENGRMILW